MVLSHLLQLQPHVSVVFEHYGYGIVFMAKNVMAGISISINDSMLPSICYTVISMVRVGLGWVRNTIWMVTYCR